MRGQRSGRRQAVVLSVAVVLSIAILIDTRWTSRTAPDEVASRPSKSTEAGVTGPSTPASTQTATAPKAHASSTAPHQTLAQARTAAVTQVAKLTKGLAAGSYSVAAVNLSTGASYAAGSTSGMWTASDYKLLLLEILLQREGGPLTGTQASEAVPMIENSDNVAGYEEFDNAGGRSGFTDGIADLGLKHTVAGHADPAFTTSSAMDFLIALRHLVQPGPLTASARSYALKLMEDVEADQRWGVGVDADRGTDFANKNGWLSIDNSNGPGEDDDGLWAVSSAGVIRINGQQVLMAVMTRHRPDFDSGVRLVEALARAIKPMVSS